MEVQKHSSCLSRKYVSYMCGGMFLLHFVYEIYLFKERGPTCDCRKITVNILLMVQQLVCT